MGREQSVATSRIVAALNVHADTDLVSPGTQSARPATSHLATGTLLYSSRTISLSPASLTDFRAGSRSSTTRDGEYRATFTTGTTSVASPCRRTLLSRDCA